MKVRERARKKNSTKKKVKKSHYQPQIVRLVDQVLYPLAPCQDLLDVLDHDRFHGVDLGLQARDFRGGFRVQGQMFGRGTESRRESSLEPTGRSRERRGSRSVLLGELGADGVEVSKGEGAARAVVFEEKEGEGGGDSERKRE